jgi:hypothetical protein
MSFNDLAVESGVKIDLAKLNGWVAKYSPANAKNAQITQRVTRLSWKMG